MCGLVCRCRVDGHMRTRHANIRLALSGVGGHERENGGCRTSGSRINETRPLAWVARERRIGQFEGGGDWWMGVWMALGGTRTTGEGSTFLVAFQPKIGLFAVWSIASRQGGRSGLFFRLIDGVVPAIKSRLACSRFPAMWLLTLRP